MFEGIRGQGYAGDIAIDDIKLSKGACAAPGIILRPWMDGWMDSDFTSFSTVFHLYQDDGWMIMRGCVQWNPVCS